MGKVNSAMNKDSFYVWYGHSYKKLPTMGLGQELVLAMMSTSDDDKIGDLVKRMNAGSVNEVLSGFMPLHAACWKNDAQVAVKLISIPGTDVNAKSARGSTPIQMTSMHESSEVFEVLLEDQRVELDIKDEDGLGLEEIICIGSVDLTVKCERLKMIEDERRKRKTGGTDVNLGEMTDDDRNKYTEKINKVNQEIGEKKRRNEREGYGKELVYALYRYGQDGEDEVAEIISTLLEDIDADNVNEKEDVENECTSLHMACEMNNVEVIAKLLPIEGIDVNARNGYGQTPIMMARQEALDLMLLDPRVDLTARGEDGNTLEDVFKQYQLRMVTDSEESQARLQEIKESEDRLQEIKESEARLQMIKEVMRKRKNTEAENNVKELPASVREKIDQANVEFQSKKRKIRDEENEEQCKNMGLVEKLIFQLENKETDKVNDLLKKTNAETMNEAANLSAVLQVACWGNRKNNEEVVEKLLSIPGIDVNIPDSTGRVPLHIACYANDGKTVSKLLTFPDINVNAEVREENSYRGRFNGFTPVMLAAVTAVICGKEALKAMLDDTRVDLGVKDNDGKGLEDPEFSGFGGGNHKECLKMIKEEMQKR